MGTSTVFNPNFNEKEKDFRKDLEGMGWISRDIDAFMFRIHSLIASETQSFPEAFFTPSKLIKRMADRTNASFKDYQQVIFQDPTPLFEECKIPLPQKREKTISPESMALINPHLRLQAMRSRSRDKTSKFSLHTTDSLSTSAGEKGLLTIGRRTTLAHVNAANTKIEKTTAHAVKEAKPKKTRAPSANSRKKPAPSFEVIAAASHRIVAETGKKPTATSGKQHLPENSPMWSTLLIKVLRGDNTLPKIMKRFPVQAEATITPQATEQTRATPVVHMTPEKPARDLAGTDREPTMVVNGTVMNARDVFNGLMMLAKKKILPDAASPFHYVEGKTMRQVDKHFRNNEIAGLDTYIAVETDRVKTLKDFMVATGIARKEGSTLVLAAPSHLGKLAKTFG